MIQKGKLFLVSGSVDESIKAQTHVYDVTIFKTFLDLESYVSGVPVVIDTLVISTDELPFNNSNMVRMMTLLNTSFFTITGDVVYLIDKSYDLNVIRQFLADNGQSNWSVYQDNISLKFITDIVSGEGRDSVENQKDIVVYRMRAKDYVRIENEKRYATEESHFLSDEEDLMGIPDVEPPKDLRQIQESECCTKFIVGMDCIERTLFAFIAAQYYALNHRTLIIEKDFEFHRLTELVTKSNVPHEYVDVTDIIRDCGAAIDKIRNSSEKLIVVGCKRKMTFNYEFLVEVLSNNLLSNIEYLIRECDVKNIPYNESLIFVMPNNVPDVLRSVSEVKQELIPSKTVFLGVQIGKLGGVNITTSEMSAVLQLVLGMNNLAVQVLQASGIELKGDEITHDIFSIIVGTNRR